ncbi:MAG: EMC3/TMCO1 family protein [Thaumarchaeota archaeon]|nr:EMC3/TMCO1 family protein [Candidatus Calditenuaceae archaeon]MDW8041938.1 EMC3/TMCO1 family protein [Nitrososphaerota archaeon]
MTVTAQALEVLLFSLGLSLLSAFLRRRTFSKEDMVLMAEAQRFQRDLLKAMREKDTKTLSRLEKQKDYYQKVQSRLMSKNLTLTLLTMGIYLGFFTWATGHYGNQLLLKVPEGFSIPLITVDGGLGFFGWYMLTALAFGTLINRVLNPTPVIDQRPAPARRG